MVIEEGEELVLEVSATDCKGVGLFSHNHPEDRSVAKLGGLNNIHFGKDHENYVLLPIIH